MSLVIIQTATPRPASSSIEGVNLGLRADVHAAGRFVEDQHARVAGQPLAVHDLLLVAAGEQPDRLCRGIGVFTRSRSIQRAVQCRLVAAADTEPRAEPVEVRQAEVEPDALRRAPARAAGGPRGRAARPRRWRRRASGSGRGRPSRASSPGVIGRTPNTASESSVRPAPTSPAMPRISPARTSNEHRRVRAAAVAEAADAQHRRRRRRRCGGRSGRTASGRGRP